MPVKACDYTAEDKPRLAFDYCRYVRSNALDEFQTNYLPEAADLQNQKEVARYIDETQTYNDGVMSIYTVSDVSQREMPVER